MIFDNCNEYLQNFRPYGIKGLPLPWSNNSRILKFPGIDTDEAFNLLQQNIYRLSAFCAGRISDQTYLLNPGMNEEAIQNNREEKIGALIAEDIISRENVWTDYDFEEVQVKLDVSDLILELLISEIVELISG